MQHLNLIAACIHQANVVVDVGSDHGYLAQKLIKQKKAHIIYNIEKNKKPYQYSCQNSRNYPNIINLFSDGLTNFNSQIKIDFCVLAGMGVVNMVMIIHKIVNLVDNYLFWSNNDIMPLRRFAFCHNYHIQQDRTFYLKKRFYFLLHLSKNKGVSLRYEDIFWGSWQNKKKDFLYFDYLFWCYQKWQNYYKFKPYSNTYNLLKQKLFNYIHPKQIDRFCKRF